MTRCRFCGWEIEEIDGLLDLDNVPYKWFLTTQSVMDLPVSWNTPLVTPSTCRSQGQLPHRHSPEPPSPEEVDGVIKDLLRMAGAA